MRIFYFLCFFFVAPALNAQQVHVGFFAGVCNYQGDLQSKKITFSQSQPAYGALVLVELSDRFHLRASFMSAAVSATDALGPNADRNLSFASKVLEGHVGLEYDLFNLYEKSVTPYVFTGINLFGFNPYATDKNGRNVFLQPLGTEGQGFFSGREKYALTQIGVPLGGGFKLRISDNVRLRAEMGLRILFTDYLDDVSSTYVDQSALLANNGAKAVEMAFRGAEFKPSLVYPGEGAKRGNPKINDYYYTGTLGISFRLQQRSDRGHLGKGQYGCPRNVGY
jgi:hypothetical protein